MRMRRLKRRKEDQFGKQFEGVPGEAKGCVEDVMESRTIGRKVFLSSRDCAYIGLLQAR